MINQAGKGDSPRPVDPKKYGENYDRIFRKNKPQEHWMNEKLRGRPAIEPPPMIPLHQLGLKTLADFMQEDGCDSDEISNIERIYMNKARP